MLEEVNCVSWLGGVSKRDVFGSARGIPAEPEVCGFGVEAHDVGILVFEGAWAGDLERDGTEYTVCLEEGPGGAPTGTLLTWREGVAWATTGPDCFSGLDLRSFAEILLSEGFRLRRA